MLEKHRFLVENYIGEDGNTYEVSDNILRVNLYNNVNIVNNVKNNKSVWYIDDLVIQIDKIDNDLVVGIITIRFKNNIIRIKQTPTDTFVEAKNNAVRYCLNDFNTLMVLNIIDDFCNKYGLLEKYRQNVYDLISIDISDIFVTIENNKNFYIKNLYHELNKVKAEYIIKESKIKNKIKELNRYKLNI